MIEIEVNCNSDEVIIKADGWKEPFEFEAKYPTQVCKILEETLNLLSEDREPLGVRLFKIDEDTRQHIGEW